MHELLPVIGQVTNSSAAEEAGIVPGDRIIEIDGNRIDIWEDLVERIEANQGGQMLLTVQRDKELLSVRVTPRLQEKRNLFGEIKTMPMLGIAPKGEFITRELGFLDSAI